jgi:hypothetical protein
MKNLKLFLLALLVAVIVIACNNDEDDDTTSITCKILSEMLEMPEGSRYSEYVYDAISGILVKIHYSTTSTSDIYSYDTLIYSSSGQLVSVLGYSPESANADNTTNYTYTNGKITKIVKTEWWDEETQEDVIYNSTADFTYNGSELTTISVSGDGDNMDFKNFNYISGNLRTLDVDFFGNDSVWAGLEATLYDSKNNVNKYIVPSWDNVLFGSSNNNMILLVIKDNLIMGDEVMHIGDTLFYRTYTYNMYDQVEVINSHPSAMGDEASTNTFTWNCIEE